MKHGDDKGTLEFVLADGVKVTGCLENDADKCKLQWKHPYLFYGPKPECDDVHIYEFLDLTNDIFPLIGSEPFCDWNVVCRELYMNEFFFRCGAIRWAWKLLQFGRMCKRLEIAISTKNVEDMAKHIVSADSWFTKKVAPRFKSHMAYVAVMHQQCLWNFLATILDHEAAGKQYTNMFYCVLTELGGGEVDILSFPNEKYKDVSGFVLPN